MQINRFRVRAIAAIFGMAGAAWLAGLGGGHAAADTRCSAANGTQVQHIKGGSGCGAKAGPGSQANAQDASDGGTAVAVAVNGGKARSLNLQPGSSALSGANTRGNAFAVTTGPKAMALAQARRGGYSVSIGGWGGQAYSGPAGVLCTGGFGAAIDTTTGKACLHTGVIDLKN